MNNLIENLKEKHKDELVWNFISHYKKLSEDFIDKHKEQVNWHNISAYQKLSEAFIIKYIDKINFRALTDNKQIILTEEFKTFIKLRDEI